MAGFDYSQMLEERKAVFSEQMQVLKSQIGSIDLKMKNLSPESEQYKILQQQKIDLTRQLYSKDKDSRERLNKLLDKVKEEEQQRKDAEEERKERNKEILGKITDATLDFSKKIPFIGAGVMVAEKSFKGLQLLGKGLNKTVKFAEKSSNFALKHLLTKDAGHGKRQGRFNFGSGRLQKYSKDYQDLGEDIGYIKAGKFYSTKKNEITGQIEGQNLFDLSSPEKVLDFFTQKENEGMKIDSIIDLLEDLQESGIEVDQGGLDLIKNSNNPIQAQTLPSGGNTPDVDSFLKILDMMNEQKLVNLNMSELDRENFFKNANAVKQAKSLDLENKVTLKETLVDFYTNVLKMQKASAQKQEKKNALKGVFGAVKGFGKGLWTVAKFFLGSKLGLALFTILAGAIITFGPYLKDKFMEWWKGDKKGNENKTDVKINEVSKNLQISVDSEGNQLSEVAQNNLKELSLLSGKDEAGVLSMIEQNNKENEATVLNLEENSKTLDTFDWENPEGENKPENQTSTPTQANTEAKSQEMLDKMKANLENQKPINTTLSINNKPGTLDLNPQQSEFLKSTNQSQANEPNIDLSDSSQKYMEQVSKEKNQKKQDLFKDFKNSKNQKGKKVSSTNTIDNILGAAGLNVTNFALRG